MTKAPEPAPTLAVAAPALLQSPSSASISAPPGEQRVDEISSPSGVQLFSEKIFSRVAGGDAPPEPQGEEARIAYRVHHYVSELKARDRVRVGLIDPYFGRLGRHLEEGFKPTWTVLDEAAGEAGGIGALKAFATSYFATASRYANSGSPYHGGERDSALFRGSGRGPDTSVAGQLGPAGATDQNAALMDLWRDTVHGRAGGVELLALIRVTQGADGSLLSVKLEAGSGRARYDELALKSVKTRLREPLSPLRQGEGLGLRGERISSLWAFRTRFSVTPPAWGLGAGIGVGVVAGCDIGSNGAIEKCFAPFQRDAWVNLKLIAVY